MHAIEERTRAKINNLTFILAQFCNYIIKRQEDNDQINKRKYFGKSIGYLRGNYKLVFQISLNKSRLK